jgi:pyruvate/2-oxoglutarate dehydrogenase complex dihydrolipoamide dehydrogenase (E3) component
MFFSMDSFAATIIAGPGESGFRAAIAAAQDGDTVTLTNQVQLQSTVAINKPIPSRSILWKPGAFRLRHASMEPCWTFRRTASSLTA